MSISKSEHDHAYIANVFQFPGHAHFPAHTLSAPSTLSAQVSARCAAVGNEIEMPSMPARSLVSVT